MAQENFKSNIEFRCQITVSVLKFRKCFAKFMTLIALLEKILSKQFIASVEIGNMARCSSQSDELRNISSIG